MTSCLSFISLFLHSSRRVDIIRLPSLPPSFFISFLTKFPWNFIKVNESTVWVQAFHSLIFFFLIMTMKLQDSFSRTHQDEDEDFKVKCIRRDHEMDSSVWYFVWLIFLLSISLTFFFLVIILFLSFFLLSNKLYPITYLWKERHWANDLNTSSLSKFDGERWIEREIENKKRERNQE